jgi:uncharacterized lipoprotein YehR (DUF1307 family)
MKRIFTISVAAVMALLMVLSLTACGNSTLGYYKSLQVQKQAV